MVELVADVPGDYALVDHSMFRAFNKGAMGTLKVEGAPRIELFSGRQSEAIYNPGTHLQRVAAVEPAAPITPPAVKYSIADSAVIEHGKQVYATICVACHQPDGRGLPNIFPPLAQSDFLMGDKDRAVRVLLQGLDNEIVVNGHKFNGVMPKLPLTDQDIAGALSYVRNNFGNSGSTVSQSDIARVRAASNMSQAQVPNRVADGT
jgi:nitrite reductase (NO-forming)